MVKALRAYSRGGVHPHHTPTGPCSPTALRSMLRRGLVAMISLVFLLIIALVAPAIRRSITGARP